MWASEERGEEGLLKKGRGRQGVRKGSGARIKVCFTGFGEWTPLGVTVSSRA